MPQTYSLSKSDLENHLTPGDRKKLHEISVYYHEHILRHSAAWQALPNNCSIEKSEALRSTLVHDYEILGKQIEALVRSEGNIHVYSFDTQDEEQRSEVSRLISKLRNTHTGHQEFIYYVQRAYELLFKQVFIRSHVVKHNYLITETPVTDPCSNYAVHRIPNVENQISNTVMCVMLRGALLPSMILSKEIQEYSGQNYTTPFALFRIKRDDNAESREREGAELRYIIDLDHSYFRPEDMEGAHLLFADPMHATGGSILTILRYLEEQNIRPSRVSLIHIITALPGALNMVRSVPYVSLYTLWMDPALNHQSYIMPGLGDAGDRLNGQDIGTPRNLLQLIANYGSNICSLYRKQIEIIEQNILG